ncbi:MAG: hypothetical protein IJP29_05820 [Lachnospiraceae bacterium]|nr:hypothetical protein [Lachnospiraceae bacterium]
MKNRMSKKEKIPLIITGMNFVTHFIPLVVVVPLVGLCSHIENHIFVTINMCLSLAVMVIYIIGIFVAPLMQLVFMIVAAKNKKWWLMWVHIVSEILLCGGIWLFFIIAEGFVSA